MGDSARLDAGLAARTLGSRPEQKEDGELCLNSAQCKSKCCHRDTGLSLARCAPKASENSECSAKGWLERQLSAPRDRRTSNGGEVGVSPEELLCPGPFSALIRPPAEESSPHSGSGPGTTWVQIPAPLPTGCVISGGLLNFRARLCFSFSIGNTSANVSSQGWRELSD
ncbi:colipase isoform X2 [Mustela nigripes]|uniref:colipase isoform X2 n=1 Tax=Mustela nigripes TaxID=77151 RepID=UPI0028166979|nr:colipase isoform X2 [Mustela nigripes]